MPDHHTPLITTIAAGLVLAYAFGLLAHRLRVQPLVGYLMAGVLVGPFTPGFVADQALAGGLVFGLALSVASTVVLMRALQERRLLDTERGRIAIGWVVVEDLAMVVALVLLPALAEATTGDGASIGQILLT